MSAPPLLDSATVTPLMETWRAGVALRRVHLAIHHPDAFNPTLSPGRFRPFRSGGTVVPTMYAAANVDAALSETIFHDLPPEEPNQVVLRSQLFGFVRSVVVPRTDLRLASLRGSGLRRLRTTAASLIHCGAAGYPSTAAFAHALYRCGERPDGLIWDSRLFPGSAALMLFGTRRPRRRLGFHWEDVDPLWKGPGFEEVLRAAEAADVTVVT